MQLNTPSPRFAFTLLTLAAAMVFHAGQLDAQTVVADQGLASSEATGGPLPGLPGSPTSPYCIFCSDCGTAGVLGNFAGGGGPLAISEVGLGAHPNRCFLTGGCSLQHPSTCGMQEDQEDLAAAVDAIWEAIATGDAMKAYRVASNQPDGSRLYYVRARQSIQVRGCDDAAVLLHIPLRGLLTPQDRRAIDADHGGS